MFNFTGIEIEKNEGNEGLLFFRSSELSLPIKQNKNCTFNTTCFSGGSMTNMRKLYFSNPCIPAN
jgi:hypothetical protein